jgi:hypothetical protein
LAAVTPEQFVSPPGNEPEPGAPVVEKFHHRSDEPFVCSPGDVDESAGARSEAEFEAELVASFHRLLEYPPWRAHERRAPRTSAENDWWLTQS